MINLIKSAIYVYTYATTPISVDYVHPCERYIEHLSLKTKIAISMGCSKVKGRRLYKKSYLEELTEGKHEQV